MTITAIPDHEGFYWAKWKIATEGTDKCPKCGHEFSTWERAGEMSDEWEVVEVVENDSDHNDPEYLMVQVPGVSQWQSIEDFYWGITLQEVKRINLR